VDLVPFKTCSYDCIYCQLGHTTCHTVERKEWVPLDAVLDELKLKLASRPDYITLSGSGEPTLYSRLGELIEHIQAMTEVPVAVLTNGSLLWQKPVRDALALADLVMPSLDAPDHDRFEFINRPHPDITFKRLLEGLEAFRREFSGKYWLELMLVSTSPNGYGRIRLWNHHRPFPRPSTFPSTTPCIVTSVPVVPPRSTPSWRPSSRPTIPSARKPANNRSAPIRAVS
jgi:wyosine [tRNA(Phe)-imidazoG37] synthetase (radical SAM superfamily)